MSSLGGYWLEKISSKLKENSNMEIVRKTAFKQRNPRNRTIADYPYALSATLFAIFWAKCPRYVSYCFSAK